MKKSRKGITQVDWVISFVIFFAFLAWFFIYIRTAAEPERGTGALLANIEKNLINDAGWSIDLVPVFVKSNLTLEEEPVIAEFPYSWPYANTGFADNRDFYMSEGKIFFLANLTNISQNAFWIAHSSENYTRANISKDFIASENSVIVDNKQFTAAFLDSQLTGIAFNGNLRLKRFNISYDRSPVLASDYNMTEFNLTPSVARYAAKTTYFNNSLYLFAENSRIYGFAYSNTLQRHNFTITATLQNYTNYYAAENSRGKIGLNGSCLNFSSNYIDLYDFQDGITFITEDFSNGSICSSNNSIILSLGFPLKNETSYWIIMHKGDYRNTTKFLNYRKEKAGNIEKQTGISLTLMSRINSTSYTGLKRNWSYSEEKEFAFFLTNASGSQIIAYKPIQPPDIANVYVSKTELYTLDKLGSKKKHTLLIKGW